MLRSRISLKSFSFLAVISTFWVLASCGDSGKSNFEYSEDYTRSQSYESMTESAFEKASVLYTDSVINELGITGGSMFPPVYRGGSTYLLGSEGHIAKFTQAKLQWVFSPKQNDAASQVESVPISNLVVGKDESAYYINSDLNLVSVDRFGKEVYTQKLDFAAAGADNQGMNQFSGSDLVGEAMLSLSDGKLILSIDSGVLAVLDTQGEILNSVDAGYSFAEGHSIEKTSNGQFIAVALTQNTFGGSDLLVIYDIDLNEVARTELEGIRIVRNPVISNGRAYIAGTTDIGDSRYGVIKCYTINGELEWEKQLRNMPRSISVAADSTVYTPTYSFGIGTSLNSIAAIDKMGEIIWNKSYKIDILSPLMITSNYLTCLAKDYEASGIYRFTRAEGTLKDFVSISDKGSFHYRPSIGRLGTIYLSRLDSLAYGYVY